MVHTQNIPRTSDMFGKETEVAKLTREQRAALQMLINHWPKEQIPSKIEFPPLLIHDSLLFCSQAIRVEDLPIGENWIWRQSNGKIITKLDDSTTVSIQKFNTRQSKNYKGDAKHPSLKAWILQVTQGRMSFSCFYCEKGFSIDPVLSNILFSNYDNNNYVS